MIQVDEKIFPKVYVLTERETIHLTPGTIRAIANGLSWALGHPVIIRDPIGRRLAAGGLDCL